MNAIPLKAKKIKTVASITSIFANMVTDKSLVKNTKEGDKNAFEQLFKKYYLRLSHYAYQYVGNMPDAEELVQETFVNIWEKRSTIDISISFKPYIYQAVKNRGINVIRGNQRRINHHSQHQFSNIDSSKTDDNIHLNELNEKLFEGLESLPPKCKKIFQMSRLEGLKHKEIAVKMEIKIKTVENQISIALKYLRNHLSEYLQIIALIFSTSNI